MSLTSNLREQNSFVRLFIDNQFPHLQELSANINKSLPNFDTNKYPKYPDSFTYSIIGTAADYRIRSFFTNEPYKATIVQSGLEFFRSVQLLAEFNKYSARFFSQAKSLRRTLKPKQEERLCRYCVFLARITHGRRSWDFSYFDDAMSSGICDIETLVATIDPKWLDDISNLASNYYSDNARLIRKFSKAFHGCSLAGSPDVRGADFDLVVDGCLVEIKTTINPKVTIDNLRQIVGYWLLDYPDKFNIRSASIYLARQRHEQRFDIKTDLLQTKRSMRAIRELFRDSIRKHQRERTQ